MIKFEIALLKDCILSDTSTELEHETDSEQYNEEHNTDQLLTPADTLPSKSADIVTCSDQDRPLESQPDFHYIPLVSLYSLQNLYILIYCNTYNYSLSYLIS